MHTGNRRNVQYSVPVKRIVVLRTQEGCTKEKEGLYLGKRRVVHRKQVVHRRQEDCTRENRRNVHCTVYPDKMIVEVLVLQFADLSYFGYAPFQ